MSIFLRRYVFATILLPLSAPYANVAVQTDWSGNSGVWGPVIEFGTDFSFDTGTNPTGFPGDLVLQLVPYIVRHDITDEFMNAHEVAAGDLDGDGDLDVAGASYSIDDIAWWENLDGIGNYWEYHFVSPCGHAECVQIHDLDGDGDEDLIGGGDGVYWWENLDGTGMSWEQHLIDSTFNFIQGVCVVDLDGDSDIDVVGGRLADSPDPYLLWWENLDGAGGSWLQHLVNSDGDCHTVQVIDMDFDGDWDLLTAGGGRVEWWENLNASGYWLGHSIAHFPGVHGVCSADLDGDGDLDVAACSDISGITDDVSWWENLDSEGTVWSKHVIDGSAWGAMDLCAVDLDEDGDMDLLGAVYYQFEKDVTWWENIDGSGLSWGTRVIDGCLDGAYSITTADFDEDGDPDVLAAGTYGEIAWWDVLCHTPEGLLESSVLDTQCSPLWDGIDWTCEEPQGTSVHFQVRSSSDPDSLASVTWSDTMYAPGNLEGYLTDGDRYVQYRVLLSTSNPDTTPVLHEVSLSWDVLKVLQTESPPPGLLQVIPNPCSGAAQIRFVLAEPSSIKLIVLDLTGRVVSQFNNAELSAGEHIHAVTDLPPGVYACHLDMGELSFCTRFVLVE